MMIDLEEIIDVVMERHKQGVTEDEAELVVIKWLAAKELDQEELQKVLASLADESTAEITSHILGGQLDMEWVRALIYTSIGIMFEIGYTTAEVQQQERMGL